MARERVALKPGWVNTDIPEEFFNDIEYLRIISFFVFYAFRQNRSSRGKTMRSYRWPKDVWKNSKGVGLKEVLLYVSDLHLDSQSYDSVTREPLVNESFVSCNNLDEMKKACQRAGLKKDFTRNRNANRIAVYNSEGNIMLSVFDHIRNSIAHGRFMIYQDGFIAFESGKIVYDTEHRKNLFDVRARMMLKKETLLRWIKIIESGDLDDCIVKEIEEKRAVTKAERTKNREPRKKKKESSSKL